MPSMPYESAMSRFHRYPKPFLATTHCRGTGLRRRSNDPSQNFTGRRHYLAGAILPCDTIFEPLLRSVIPPIRGSPIIVPMQ